MKTINLLHRQTGATIYSKTGHNNTILQTLYFAHKDGVNLDHVDLKGADLAFGNFLGIKLTNADLRHADITGTSFNEGILDGSNLSLVMGNYASFENTKLHRVHARRGEFINAFFKDAHSMEGTFDECNFTRADLRSFITRGTTFKRVTLDGAIIDSIDTRIRPREPGIYIPKCNENGCDPGCKQSCRNSK